MANQLHGRDVGDEAPHLQRIIYLLHHLNPFSMGCEL